MTGNSTSSFSGLINGYNHVPETFQDIPVNKKIKEEKKFQILFQLVRYFGVRLFLILSKALLFDTCFYLQINNHYYILFHTIFNIATDLFSWLRHKPLFNTFYLFLFLYHHLFSLTFKILIIIICENLRVYFSAALHYRYRARRSNQEVTAASANAMHSSRRPAKISPNRLKMVLQCSTSSRRSPMGYGGASRSLDCAVKKIVHHLSFKTIWNSGRKF